MSIFNLLLKSNGFLILVFLFLLHSCKQENLPSQSRIIKKELINSIDKQEYLTFLAEAKKRGIKLPESNTNSSKLILSTQIFKLNIYRVTYLTKHPSENRQIMASGVAIVPISKEKKRILIHHPGTYYSKKTTPSSFFKDTKFDLDETAAAFQFAPLLVFAKAGFVVLIPDYLGYGESRKDCFHPYYQKEINITSIKDFIDATRKDLTAQGVELKTDLVISGYSWGANLATSLAKDIELNPKKYDYKVKALSVLALPATFKSSFFKKGEQALFYLPYLYYGLKQNNKIDLAETEIFKEPFASEAINYYSGNHTVFDLMSYYNVKNEDLYTENFIANFNTDPLFKDFRMFFYYDAPITNWKNQFPFKMYHGTSDDLVFYKDDVAFHANQKDLGGNISFEPIYFMNHLTALPFYFIKNYFWLNKYL